MVMRPGSAATLRKRLPVRGIRCLLGWHDRWYVRLRATGEDWATTLYHCRRCLRPLPGSFAANLKEQP